MGVTELWSILEPVRQSVSLYSLSGKTLAVDLSLWVCEAQHVQGMMGRVTKPHLRNLFFRVSSLTLMGVKLVFVMEGEAPKIKAETMSKRTEMRFGGTKAKSIPKPVKNTNRGRFNAVLRECAQMLDCLGVPWVTAAGEAEAMCAFLDSQGLVDGCITNDGDAFLYGARTVYRNFNMTTKDPQVDCYQSSRVQEELGLCRETLVGLAVLLGCDYIPKGIAGVGREQTLKLIHSLRGQTLLQKFSEWSSGASGDSELQMKKVTHCLVCRHPGSAKAHERSGCVFCVSERFCSPQDYDSQCPCEWHQTQALRQASSLENNIRKRTLASEHFPFTHIINEFLLTKDKPVQAFRRRKPNLLLMQEFALEKMDWPKHYSSEKLLTLMTYTEMVNRRLGRDSHTHMQPIRIYKARVRNGVSCLEVIWKTPEHYVFVEGCEEQAEVRTVEEEALFSLAFPKILQEFQRERNQAQEKKTKKKKPKVKKETLADSHDAVSDLFSQMTLNTDPQVVSSAQNPPQPDLPPYPGIQVQTPPSGNSHSVSALIGQLHLSSIDWDSASFTASPSQNTHETDLRPAENDNCSLKERIITNKQQAKDSDGIADGKTDLRPAENNICSLKERIVAQKQRSKDSDGIADDKTDLRPAQHSLCSLKEQMIMKKQQTKHPGSRVDDKADLRPAEKNVSSSKEQTIMNDFDRKTDGKTDLRPAQHSLCSLKEQIIMKKQQTKNPEYKADNKTDLRPAESLTCSLKQQIIITKQMKHPKGRAEDKTDLRPVQHSVCSLKEQMNMRKQTKTLDCRADNKTDLRPAESSTCSLNKQIVVTGNETDLRPAHRSKCSLKEQMIIRKQTKDPDGCSSIPSAPANAQQHKHHQKARAKTTTTAKPSAKTSIEFSDSDTENRPKTHKVKAMSRPPKPLKTSLTHALRPQRAELRAAETPEKKTLIQVHHGKVESEDSDASVDSPRPLAERLKMRFAK
ncbi:flap endonuclease GEN homolog 1 isoform X1 [Danio rerio]|uniref:Flap endonuclease GEN homolog 1 n=3 Tax=Danio rerio TaxID=7955 RepID=A0A8M9PUX7_DANRE|nr:flap endonuclease GEN homolog 1 isoform X2 [Danio rerio]XP_021330863.1 flap endonuclease GEN homolog 1 isoform X1 [Danio rerio]|eukprot:XP_009298211.1 flap endonuclease GEN homolog 1 isoform X2 [Danio rerio]